MRIASATLNLCVQLIAIFNFSNWCFWCAWFFIIFFFWACAIIAFFLNYVHSNGTRWICNLYHFLQCIQHQKPFDFFPRKKLSIYIGADKMCAFFLPEGIYHLMGWSPFILLQLNCSFNSKLTDPLNQWSVFKSSILLWVWRLIIICSKTHTK